ncbi:putative aBC-type transport system involved in Fe-S cluster assembly permease and ATPase component [Burkholderia cepacia]|nr:putative aBC-type transport system involved in Fe-S cluster assembly permease and ATPase component [Burkholderia cepacia]
MTAGVDDTRPARRAGAGRDRRDERGLRRRIAVEPWRAIRHYRAHVLAAIALLVLAKAAAISVPSLLTDIVDGSGRAAGKPVAWPVLLLLLFAYATARARSRPVSAHT